MKLFAHLLLAVMVCSTRTLGNRSDTQVIGSGCDPVKLYSTAIRFKLTLMNKGIINHQVTVSYQSCCLDIDINDTDCEIMQLASVPQSLVLGPAVHENNTDTVTFTYRNLYARYRIGNCSFTIGIDGESQSEWMHTIHFNTTPEDGGNASLCTGLDQDPDRDCTPVDCAIKYKGNRNFYRQGTGKCEPVVPCHTRSRDGFSVTGYYDWEENICVLYKWFEDDNYLKQIESDTEIPVKIDPSQSKYFPDLEPQLKQRNDTIVCNHGKLEGYYCICDQGWISSGIHRDDPITFHWCDTPEMTTSFLTSPIISAGEPRKLNGLQEISSIICSELDAILFLGVPAYEVDMCNEKVLWRS